MLQRYHHWQGQSTGIWQRRLTITRYGLRLCLQSKLLIGMLAITWVTALGLVGIYFFVGQLMAPESALLASFVEKLGPQIQNVIRGAISWILLYPEITVDGIYRVTFYYVTLGNFATCFVAISLFVPKLIAHDQASQAIIIYNSKALTRFDYLLGKFGIVFTLLSALTLAPLTFAWLAGNLMSPDWSFFVHSFPSLARSLFTSGIAVVTFSLIALAISSLAKKTSTATAIWCMFWVITNIISGAAEKLFNWGTYISPHRLLNALADQLYDLPGILTSAKASLPFFDQAARTIFSKTPEIAAQPAVSLYLPLGFAAAFCLVAIGILFQRTRSE